MKKVAYGFCFRPIHERDNCSGYLHLWVDCLGDTCCIATLYDVEYGEWDPVTGEIKLSGCAPGRYGQLIDYAECMEQDILRVEGIIRDLETKGRRYTANDIIRQYRMVEAEA